MLDCGVQLPCCENARQAQDHLRFRVRRGEDFAAEDFRSASRVALRRKEGGWERDSCSGVSSDSGVQRAEVEASDLDLEGFTCDLLHERGGATRRLDAAC